MELAVRNNSHSVYRLLPTNTVAAKHDLLAERTGLGKSVSVSLGRLFPGPFIKIGAGFFRCADDAPVLSDPTYARAQSLAMGASGALLGCAETRKMEQRRRVLPYIMFFSISSVAATTNLHGRPPNHAAAFAPSILLQPVETGDTQLSVASAPLRLGSVVKTCLTSTRPKATFHHDNQRARTLLGGISMTMVCSPSMDVRKATYSVDICACIYIHIYIRMIHISVYHCVVCLCVCVWCVCVGGRCYVCVSVHIYT